MSRRLPLVTPSRPLAGHGEVGADFIRGFVATGILSAVQDQPARLRLDRRTLRCAMQGGSALAAGTYAMRAWRRSESGQALAGVAIGLAAVATFEHLLQDQAAKEKANGKEEA